MVGGFLPGIGAVLTLSLLLPFAFSLSPAAGLLLLASLQKGVISGGTFSSILIGTPGTVAAAAVIEDGQALARQGKAGKAIQTSLLSGIFGDTVSDFVLIFVAAPLAMVALKFGPAEVFSLMVLSLMVIGILSSKQMAKGLIMACLGLIIATIGMDAVLGKERLTFGILNLRSGVPLVPALIGFYAISEMICQIELLAMKKEVKIISSKSQNKLDNRLTWKEFKETFKCWVVGSGIGTIIGALPGIGSATGAFVSLGFSKKIAKKPEEYGKGSLEAIAAAESASCGVAGANLIPALSLGIPGDPPAVIMLGALMGFGLYPGPTLFRDAPDVLYLLFAGMLLSHVVNYPVGLIISKIGRFLLKIPEWCLLPIVILLAATGAFADANSIFGLKIALIFGIAGYIMRRGGYPLSPLAIGFILGARIETPLRQALIISSDSFLVLIQKPISLFLLILAMLVFITIFLGEIGVKIPFPWAKNKGSK